MSPNLGDSTLILRPDTCKSVSVGNNDFYFDCEENEPCEDLRSGFAQIAYDRDATWISIADAERGGDHICLDCYGSVVVRKGPILSAHFAHKPDTEGGGGLEPSCISRLKKSFWRRFNTVCLKVTGNLRYCIQKEQKNGKPISSDDCHICKNWTVQRAGLVWQPLLKSSAAILVERRYTNEQPATLKREWLRFGWCLSPNLSRLASCIVPNVMNDFCTVFTTVASTIMCLGRRVYWQ